MESNAQSNVVNAHPVDNGWDLVGDAFWVATDAEECWDPVVDGLDGNLMSPEFPCALEQGGGFVNLTPPAVSQAGGVFRRERARFDDMRARYGF